LTSGSRLPMIIFDFRKSTSAEHFAFRKSTFGDIFWLLEVDFWWTFWLSEVDFQWYILTSGSRLLMIYFDFWKLTSESQFEVWCSWVSLNGQRIFWKFKKKIGGAEEMLGGLRRKTPGSKSLFFSWTVEVELWVWAWREASRVKNKMHFSLLVPPQCLISPF